MQTLRTPDARFLALPGFPYQPHYIEDLSGFEGVRVHYLDEGDPKADTVALCLHGNPSWSYLYRKMIPVFTHAGLRVVAPDLIGFGRSDKPVDESVHRFDFHRAMLLAFIERLDLRNTMLVCQDWGGLLGLTVPMEQPERFTRLLVMNTALAIGEHLSEGFLQWRAFSASQPDLDVAALFQRSTPVVSEAEAAAYAAPFPDRPYKAALRAFPQLVPDSPQADGAAVSRQALRWWGTEWSGRSFMAIGAADPVLPPPTMRRLAQAIRGCPEPMVLPDAGHFVQEWGEPVAQAAMKAMWP